MILIGRCSQSVMAATTIAAALALSQAVAVPPGEGRSSVLASAGEVAISSEDLKIALSRSRAASPGDDLTEEELQRLVKNLIRTRAFANLARKQQLDREPGIRLRMESILHDELIAIEVDGKARLGNVSEARIRDYYREQGTAFGLPKRLGLHYFMISRARYGARTLEVAQEAERRASASGPSLFSFRTLAKEYQPGGDSEDVKELLLEAETIQAAMRDPELARLVRAADSVEKVGAVAKPVETANGVYVVRLSDRCEERQQPLVEVREEIRQVLNRQDRHQALEALQARAGLGATVEINREELLKCVGEAGFALPPKPGSNGR